jgi:hypothetical protein
MKWPIKPVLIHSVPLLNAVLCGNCECISESRNNTCAVCGGSALVNLRRLLGSAIQAEPDVDVNDPLISRELEMLVYSAVPPRRRFP